MIEGTYEHKPLYGLPSSLLTKENKTIAVISLMQRKSALNRDMRRELVKKKKNHSRCERWLRRWFEIQVSNPEIALLSYYLDPNIRFFYFWRTAEKLYSGKGAAGPRSFSLAVDAQLLSAYDSQWHLLLLDEKALEETGLYFPEIREKIATLFPHDIKNMPLGVFMLWPRLLEDINKWEHLDQPRRTVVKQAVFSLSSIGLTDWFVRKALGIIPKLHDEYAFMIDKENESEPEEEKSFDIWESSEAISGEDEWRQQLSELLRRLNEVSQELHETPTKKVVAKLISLSADFECLSEKLPDDQENLAQLFESKLASLLEFCQGLQSDSAFDWLDGRLLNQIEARWIIARHSAQEDHEQFDRLVSDAELAKTRGVEATELFRHEVAEKITLEKEIAHKREQSSTAQSLIERRQADSRRTELQQKLLVLETALPTLQDDWLAAVSPYASPFDHMADYNVAQVSDDEVLPPSDTLDAPKKSTLQSVPQEIPGNSDGALATPSEVLETSETETMPTEPDIGADNKNTFDVSVDLENGMASEQLEQSDSVAEPLAEQAEGDEVDLDSAEDSNPSPKENQSDLQIDSVAEPLDKRAAWQEFDLDPVEDSTPSSKENQSDENQSDLHAAGMACRPVWWLLREAHLSLAYQDALALEDSNPALKKAPLTSLLACVALARHLTLPDSSVQETLSQYLAKLDPMAFSEGGPPVWRTALNLLLVTGTMRAMILVPSSGAATIASYVHLDSRFTAVYNLLQRLRHFSERLQGFRIEPATLRIAGSEAAHLADLKALAQEADEWLRVQAPAVTIKYAPATKIWLNWITKPNGLLSQMVAPIVSNRQTELQRVKELIATISDFVDFRKLVNDTDRKVLKRKKGDDIYAGALEHLKRAAETAASLARRWVTLVEVQGQGGDRMRTVLQELREDLGKQLPLVEQELSMIDEDDRWGAVKAARSVLLEEIQAIWSLFDPSVTLPLSEPPASVVLSDELLLVPTIRFKEDRQLENESSDIEKAIAKWVETPNDWRVALEARMKSGDMLGAEWIVWKHQGSKEFSRWQTDWKREVEAWRSALRRDIVETRREIEVGSAYGYLNDSERGALESEIVEWEAQEDKVRRFDLATLALDNIKDKVQRNRNQRSRDIRKTLDEFPRSERHAADLLEIDKVLSQGDIATANELLQRLTSGYSLMLEDDNQRDKFREFFPRQATALESWLESQRNRSTIVSAIRTGQGIPDLNFQRVAGAQRDQAASMFDAWLDIKSRKQAEPSRLAILLSGFGFTVKQLTQKDRLQDRETWELNTAPIEDRNICPVPLFGSHARGRYRLLCVWGRPTEDEILHLAGDSTTQRPTIILYFGRMTERKWVELSRIAKTKRRSFLLVDEVLLLYLCSQAGSRFRVLFDAALPFSYSAPYDATAGLVPPEMFYGRGAELDAVRGLNGRCFIYGGRQLGKTALLRRAEQSFHSPSEGRYSCWIDLRPEGIGVSRAVNELWVVLTEKLKSIGLLQDSVKIPSPSKKNSVDIVIAQLRSFLDENHDRRVLLLLDEADRFFEQDGRHDFSETRLLKQLMDETGRRFKVVFAGLHNVLRMTERANHPLAHFGEPIKIGPLIDEHEIKEAQNLVIKPMAASGFEFESHNLVIRILAQTNYYPSLIQLYCSHLLRHMLRSVASTNSPSGPRYKITSADIESVYSSGALRAEIRNKFRLTLQLDPRYEVVAYAMALEALHGRYEHNEGMDWSNIRHHCALHWWSEGFRDTSELDFRVLLDEMIELGVLRQIREGRYTLRNPNVLLLLGSQEEIEAVLLKDREPSVEFESAVFRPALRMEPSSSRRGPLTYQQLSELLRPTNITIISGCLAGGVTEIHAGLKDYLGQTGNSILFDKCTDREIFGNELNRTMKNRSSEGTTVIVVPHTVPWSALWLQDARKKMNHLRSEQRHVSMVFVADPKLLWEILIDEDTLIEVGMPWMTLLPWQDAFVRHWLEELQLTKDDPDLQKSIMQVTGYWPYLLFDLVKGCTEVNELQKRIIIMQTQSNDPTIIERRCTEFGLNTTEPRDVLLALAKWQEPIDPNELAIITERSINDVKRALRWAELLGITEMEGRDYWSVEPVVSVVLNRLNV